MILNVYLRFNKLWTWFVFILSLLAASTNLSFGQCACHQRGLGTAPSSLFFIHSFYATSSQVINIAHTKHILLSLSLCLFSFHYIYAQQLQKIITAAKKFHFTSEIKRRQFFLIFIFCFNKSNGLCGFFKFLHTHTKVIDTLICY